MNMNSFLDWLMSIKLWQKVMDRRMTREDISYHSDSLFMLIILTKHFPHHQDYEMWQRQIDMRFQAIKRSITMSERLHNNKFSESAIKKYLVDDYEYSFYRIHRKILVLYPDIESFESTVTKEEIEIEIVDAITYIG